MQQFGYQIDVQNSTEIQRIEYADQRSWRRGSLLFTARWSYLLVLDGFHASNDWSQDACCMDMKHLLQYLHEVFTFARGESFSNERQRL
jgi:hypothetical protein